VCLHFNKSKWGHFRKQQNTGGDRRANPKFVCISKTTGGGGGSISETRKRKGCADTLLLYFKITAAAY